MGGNALKMVETRRVSREEYALIRDEVLKVLRNDLEKRGIHNLRVREIPSYRTKESFGDIDFLVETFETPLDIQECIVRLFSPKQIVSGDPKQIPNFRDCVWSFDYKKVQIDFMLTPSDIFDSSLHYYSYNDLGNLAGRIFKKFGFKYGHKGLSVFLRKEDNPQSVFAEIIVSRDTQKIMEFGGFDWNRFQAGFEDLEEIFRWVSASPYFHKDMYLLENRNHRSRTKDKKRTTYRDFLVWCATTEGLNAYPWGDFKEAFGYQGSPEFLEKAFGYFDGFEALYRATEKANEKRGLFLQRFNGRVVSALTGLQNKELGDFMKQWIAKTGPEDFQKKILNMSPDEIVAAIQGEYKAVRERPSFR